VLVLMGGGVNAANVAEALLVADGVAVVTALKGGDMRNAVDLGLARAFVRAATGV
jgi:predicted TIM-barrel enzyme